MRAVVAVLLLAGCVRTGPPQVLVARCTNCANVVEPTLGMANYKTVGNCRYEVRKGEACCLVRWDIEEPRTGVTSAKVVLEEKPDGTSSLRSYEPDGYWKKQPLTAAMCPGERFEVCGEFYECAP